MIRSSFVHLLAFLALASPSAMAEEPVSLTFEQPRPMPWGLGGYNVNLLTATARFGTTYDGESVGAALTELQPRAMRFPGGTTANNYLWQEDSYAEQPDDRTKWAARQLSWFRSTRRAVGMEAFADVCRERGIAPVYVLNVFAETPESVRELAARWREIGLSPAAIELGNEPYWDPRSLMNVWPYLERARPLAKTLREIVPGAKIGVCVGSVDPSQAYERNWNAKVAADQSWYDAVIYHEYYGGQGIAVEKGRAVPLAEILDPEGYVAEPVRRLAETFPGKPIWLTEWNIGSKGLERWKDTGAESLFIARITADIAAAEPITLSGFHQIFGGAFGAYDFATGGVLERKGSSHVLRLLGAALRGGETIAAANRTGGVAAFRIGAGSGSRLCIVNAGSDAITLSDSLTEGLRHQATLSCPPEGSMLSAAIDRSEIAGPATVPGYSVCVLSSQRLELPQAPTPGRNLLPPLPHLTLWHKPYARQQPRLDPTGTYEIDVEKYREQDAVFVKWNLSGLGLQPNVRYRATLEGRSEPSGALLMIAPGQDAKPAVMHGEFAEQTVEFTLPDAAAAADESLTIDLLLTGEALGKLDRVTLRRFAVRPMQ